MGSKAMLTELSRGTYLGPARVVVRDGNRVALAFPDQEVWAVMALAFPYEPQAGDTVLAAGQDANWDVIGLLKGTGPCTFSAPGDLRLSAPNGKLELLGGRGVHVRTPRFDVVAETVEVVARSLTEKVQQACVWVKDLFRVRAGKAQTT